ncbi:hypothetical protein GCM10009861_00250 [Neomicrococcus aestuarii]
MHFGALRLTASANQRGRGKMSGLGRASGICPALKGFKSARFKGHRSAGPNARNVMVVPRTHAVKNTPAI